MISPQEIEAYAVKIAEPGFAVSETNIGALIGHLDFPDSDAVLARAVAISRQRGAAHLAEADTLETITRLAHASGMPAGEKPIRWLQERGLIEKVDGGWRLKTPKPVAVAT
jgi:hypothetical protein